eukprot:1143143-Lingulodinium_polyedra.AAC.1
MGGDHAKHDCRGRRHVDPEQLEQRCARTPQIEERDRRARAPAENAEMRSEPDGAKSQTPTAT